jgi:hypothetical protein
MTDQDPPRQFEVKKFANVGASEDFVKEMLDLVDIVNATMIFGDQRNELSGRIGSLVTEGLIPAFMKLREIRASVGQDVPVLDHLQMYEDFAGKLWKSYKEMMQRTAKVMGFDVGFLFQKDKGFEDGLKVFREKNPAAAPVFEEYLRNVRRLWHTDLANFRNTIIEHPDGDRSQFGNFYEPQFAEALFAAVWSSLPVAMLRKLLIIREVTLSRQPCSATPAPLRGKAEANGRATCAKV